MRLLLDTHTFLWFVLNDRQLSEIAVNLIVDPANDVWISAASYWEIAIKVSLGKYQLPGAFDPWMEQQIQVNDFEILPIKIAHASAIEFGTSALILFGSRLMLGTSAIALGTSRLILFGSAIEFGTSWNIKADAFCLMSLF